MVICDEGHRIKNEKTSIYIALNTIRTRRRVVLTGYPLQNNLEEYWYCFLLGSMTLHHSVILFSFLLHFRVMINFVRPDFLGAKSKFNNMFRRPIENGQCVDSNPTDVKLMRDRVHVLRTLLKGLVQRRSHAVLRDTLPHKEEHVLFLRMTPLQKDLYRQQMSQFLENKSISNPINAFVVGIKIWNHPDIFLQFLQEWEGWPRSRTGRGDVGRNGSCPKEEWRFRQCSWRASAS